MVADRHGANAISDTVIPSARSVEETDQINGDVVATMITVTVDDNDNELLNNVESTKDDDDRGTMECSTPISRSHSSARKKRGAFSLFRAMFQSSFGRSDSMKKTDCATSPKKKAVAAGADDDGEPVGGDSPSWKTLVDGVRPLRLRGQELEYYPPPPPLGHPDEVGMTSRYASAVDLHHMDIGGEEEEDAPAAEAGDPNSIDMQAEEFIAKFYEQFTSESFDGRASE
ncbi:uncharacterized protein LOC101770035 [Setaria italica]|uniref:uncharacterized protein LOC101770035 n=1 Tax=Setaria italica TaxID=4555 RepID=UPI000BE55AB3|nr:uncharacterized protein LOC101770035 [Setaria italica]